MKIPDIIIAVDGYSSTGKSSFARLVARKHSLMYLDSGALYRGVTLHAIERGYANKKGGVDVKGLVSSLAGLDLHFAPDGKLYMGERRIEKEIRTMHVSGLVSPVATIPEVRDFVDEKLHEFGRTGRVIMDGRDIGTSVFPEAGLKIFITATEEVRAKRRYDEMRASGDAPDMAEVLKNLKERDYIDSHRETAPLSRAADAYVLDNSGMSISEEIAWFEGLIQGKFGIME